MRLALLCSAGLALAGCGASPAGTPTSSRTATVSATPTDAITALSDPVTITDADNHHTVRLRSGQGLVVVLSSTYWMIQPVADPGVLRTLGAAAVSPAPGCVPGSGCGTVTEIFVAAAAGQASVTASRTSCGEAVACTGGAGMFDVAVVVSS